MRWFKKALSIAIFGALLLAPFSNSLPTSAQTKVSDPVFDISIAQLHLQLKEVEEDLAQDEPETTGEIPNPPVDCRIDKCIALTFDDGPTSNTFGILKSLKRAGAKATFFAIGLQLREHPEIANLVVSQGHELGGHSYDHRKLQYFSRAELERDFSYVSKLMFEATGSRPKIFRPPFGEFDNLVQEVAQAPVVLWSVDPKDWLTRNPDETYERVVENAKPGAIVVMHDNLASTRFALPKILKTLKSRGYRFVTVSELITDMRPGEVYRSGPDGK